MGAPGWYPDGTGGMRYFDGQHWTEHRAIKVGGERRFTIHYGFALLAFFALLGTLFPGLAWLFGDDPSNPHDDFLVTLGVLWMLWGLMWVAVWTAFAIQHTLKSR